MRQLFMLKKKFVVDGDCFITNRSGDVLYTVERLTASPRSTYIIYNDKQEEVVRVNSDDSNVASELNVLIDGDYKFIVEETTSSDTPTYKIAGEELSVYDNWSKMNFDIMNGYRKVAKVRNRWVSPGDSYELTIFEEDCELESIGLLVLLESIQQNELQFA